MTKTRLKERLSKILVHRWQPYAVVAIAALLVTPSIWSPLIADDYIQRCRLDPSIAFPGFDQTKLDLFSFADGSIEQRRELMDEGIFSWWAPEGLKISFWRPLSAATHLLDFTFWRDSAVLMHLHGILWFIALLVIVSVLFRRLLPRSAAALALLLYAMDDARGMVLSFVANRNALIAAFFAVAALVVHDRWRRDGWSPGVVVAPLLLALGLLGGESALAITAYLFAYQMFLDRGALAHRLARLAPYGAVVVVWAVVYRSLGYGTHGGGVYLNPANEPLSFASELVLRLPVLLLGQMAIPPSDFWLFYSDTTAVVVYVVAWVVLAGFAMLFLPILRADPTMRFWVSGALIAALPVCATFTSDRLLVMVGLGAMGALAMFMTRQLGLDPAGGAKLPKSSNWARRLALVLLILIHLVLAPLLLPVRCLTTAVLAGMESAADEVIPRSDEVRERTLVVVASPFDGLFTYIPMTREVKGVPRPRALRVLATGQDPIAVRRLDEHTLRIRPERGFYRGEVERMVRSRSVPMKRGETVRLPELTVTVTEITDDGRAAEAEFRFERPLEDASLLWMRIDREEGVVLYRPPPVGETELVSAPH